MSDEQAVLVSHHFGLSDLETDYFLELVRFDRASAPEMRNLVLRRLSELRKISGAEKTSDSAPFSSQEESRYLSHWYFDAIRIATGISGLQTESELSEHFNLPIKTVREVLRFLTLVELCKKQGEKYILQKHFMRFDHSSSLDRYLLNWRELAAQRMTRTGAESLFHSIPIAVDAAAAAEVARMIRKLLVEITERAKSASPDRLMCFNVDWFET